MILFASEIPSDKKFFDKEKNEKKRKPSYQVVEIGQASFFEKILPDRVEIFLKTRRAWTFFSEYLELIFALFFFIFCFEYPIGMFLFNRIKSDGLGVELEDGRLWKCINFL